MTEKEKDEEKIRKVIGESLKKERIKRDYSLEMIAEHSDVSSDFLCKVEQGERQLELSKLIFLAELYGIELDELLGIINFDIHAYKIAKNLIVKHNIDDNNKIVENNLINNSNFVPTLETRNLYNNSNSQNLDKFKLAEENAKIYKELKNTGKGLTLNDVSWALKINNSDEESQPNKYIYQKNNNLLTPLSKFKFKSHFFKFDVNNEPPPHNVHDLENTLLEDKNKKLINYILRLTNDEKDLFMGFIKSFEDYKSINSNNSYSDIKKFVKFNSEIDFDYENNNSFNQDDIVEHKDDDTDSNNQIISFGVEDLNDINDDVDDTEDINYEDDDEYEEYDEEDIEYEDDEDVDNEDVDDEDVDTDSNNQIISFGVEDLHDINDDVDDTEYINYEDDDEYEEYDEEDIEYEDVDNEDVEYDEDVDDEDVDTDSNNQIISFGVEDLNDISDDVDDTEDVEYEDDEDVEYEDDEDVEYEDDEDVEYEDDEDDEDVDTDSINQIVSFGVEDLNEISDDVDDEPSSNQHE